MIDEGPGEHDRHLMDDDREDTVACARCGESIWAHCERCPRCGVHFVGEAWEFKAAGEKKGGRGRWAAWVAVGAAVALIVAWWLRGGRF